jgi:hypothetical protein
MGPWLCAEMGCHQSATLTSDRCYYHRKSQEDLSLGRQRHVLDDDPLEYGDDGD